MKFFLWIMTVGELFNGKCLTNVQTKQHAFTHFFVLSHLHVTGEFILVEMKKGRVVQLVMFYKQCKKLSDCGTTWFDLKIDFPGLIISTDRHLICLTLSHVEGPTHVRCCNFTIVRCYTSIFSTRQLRKLQQMSTFYMVKIC